MSTTEKAGSLAGRPMPNGDPATWLYVADLPTPPEVAAEVERYCQERGWRGWFSRWWHKRLIQSQRDHLTRRHYYAGKRLVCQQTPRGELILHVSEPEAEEDVAFVLTIPEADRESITRETVLTGDEDYSDLHYFLLGYCHEVLDSPNVP